MALGLGANLGDRERTLARAVELLDELPGLEILALSPLYRSAPWGDTDQPEFLNAVAVGRSTLSARDLLGGMQGIERALGKQVVRKWGPRTIDLDLLLYGTQAITQEGLKVPHPHIRRRPFVYLPLRDAIAEMGDGVPPEWRAFTEADAEGAAIEQQTLREPATGDWPARLVAREWQTMSHCEEQTTRLGEALGRAAAPGWIVALSGPLGAGKSCLVRGMARGLAIAGPVPSPSYTLCRDYPAARVPFQHWDFYRLDGEDDLESAAFPEEPETRDKLIAVEWADRFPEVFPAARTVRIAIERPPGNDHRRLLFCFPAGALALRRALGRILVAG